MDDRELEPQQTFLASVLLDLQRRTHDLRKLSRKRQLHGPWAAGLVRYVRGQYEAVRRNVNLAPRFERRFCARHARDEPQNERQSALYSLPILEARPELSANAQAEGGGQLRL